MRQDWPLNIQKELSMTPRKKKEPQFVNQSLLNEDDFNLLLDIKSASERKGHGFYVPNGLEVLVDNELIEINYGMNNPRNKKQYAVRITQKGNDLTMAKKTVNIEETTMNFEVGTFNPAAVKAKAPSARRGRESKYHLDKLDAGQFIFVPVNEKHVTSEDVAKSLTGTVQAANKKFSEPTGETKVVTRKVKGSDEKIEKTVDIMRTLRKFSVYAYTNNGIDGAAIVREM